MKRKPVKLNREMAYDAARGACQLKLKGCSWFAGWKTGHIVKGQWSCERCWRKVNQ